MADAGCEELFWGQRAQAACFHRDYVFESLLRQTPDQPSWCQNRRTISSTKFARGHPHDPLNVKPTDSNPKP